MPRTFPIGFSSALALWSTLSVGPVGTSTEAESLDQRLHTIRVEREQTVTLARKSSAAIADLHAILSSQELEARPSDLAVKEALRLLAVLPDDIPAPEVDVVHDGSILLDWQVNPNQVFTLSLSGNHCIPYAWMNGLERGSALAKFYRDQAPQILVQTLREIVNG